MNNLNYDELIINLNKKKKHSTIIVVSLMVGATLLNTGLLFLSTEYNKGLMEFILSAIYVVVGWIALYFLLSGIIQSKRKILSINSILNGERKEFIGEIKKIGNPITLSNASKCFEIMINYERVYHKLYFDEQFNIMPFEVGNLVKFSVSNNFITGYEIVESNNE